MKIKNYLDCFNSRINYYERELKSKLNEDVFRAMSNLLVDFAESLSLRELQIHKKIIENYYNRLWKLEYPYHTCRDCNFGSGLKDYEGIKGSFCYKNNRKTWDKCCDRSLYEPNESESISQLVENWDKGCIF
jgi:hypothetical protein